MQYKKNKLYNLESKTVIITGAARGNGLAIAKGLYNEGAKIVLTDKLSKELNNAYKYFDNSRCIKILANINNKSDRKKIIATARKKFSKIDGLINNAAISIPNVAEKYSLKDWGITMETNLTSSFFLSQEVVKFMIKNKISGSIINITSLASNFGMPNNPAYVASKGGLKYLSKAMALDWGKFNIRVNNICPGYIKTNMTSSSFSKVSIRNQRSKRTILNKWGNSEDLVGAAVYLISDASSYVTGTELKIDGGWSAKGL